MFYDFPIPDYRTALARTGHTLIELCRITGLDYFRAQRVLNGLLSARPGELDAVRNILKKWEAEYLANNGGRQ